MKNYKKCGRTKAECGHLVIFNLYSYISVGLVKYKHTDTGLEALNDKNNLVV